MRLDLHSGQRAPEPSIMSLTPLKRRKTEGSFQRPKPIKMSAVKSWPTGKIPLEVFIEIMKFLPRSSIQNMRLVNKEFEEKVLAHLFRVVVVPFKPEIYGIAPEPPLGGFSDEATGGMRNGAIMLQDNGMRIFNGFGEHISKFAMSFELDETKLANPPAKCEQEAITSFWGIYRWPFKGYNRYAQLEGLEQTADETRTMAKALKHILNAKELGLSIDGGLGWLNGPDINERVWRRGENLMVFGSPNFVPEPRPSEALQSRPGSTQSASPSQDSQMHEMFERMLRAAGTREEHLEESIRMMLDTEAYNVEITSSNHATQAGADKTSSSGTSFTLNLRRRTRTSQIPAPNTNTPSLQATSATAAQTPDTLLDDMDLDLDLDDDEDDDAEETTRVLHTLGNHDTRTERLSFRPSELTNAQREMLLEVEWAQRAFMQSYTIAVIDNATTFHAIETLTIARIPNRHLPILRRADFWDGLPNLAKLSLAVIPEWREVNKLPTSYVQDIKIPPSQSLSGVFQFLGSQIAHRKHIKSLHFEWLCGGEYAPGIFSRNLNILAAPVVEDAAEMVNRTQTHRVLELPHVQHLSLKNCWFSPHTLHRFTTYLKNRKCRSLAFHSVSLTASIPTNAEPQPGQGHPTPVPGGGGGGAAAAAAAAPFQVPQNNATGQLPVQHWNQPIPNGTVAAVNFPFMQPPADGQVPNQTQYHGPNMMQVPTPAQASMYTQANAQMQAQVQVPITAQIPPLAPLPPPLQGQASFGNEWLENPRTGSWAYFINLLTPNATLADMRYRYDEVNFPAPPPRKPTKIVHLEFDSCGYITLPLSFDQSTITAPAPVQTPASIMKRKTELEAVMMKPSDNYLGIVVNHISPKEVETLETAFGMTVGWDLDNTDKNEVFDDAKVDGIIKAGEGRFTGTIFRYSSA